MSDVVFDTKHMRMAEVVGIGAASEDENSFTATMRGVAEFLGSKGMPIAIDSTNYDVVPGDIQSVSYLTQTVIPQNTLMLNVTSGNLMRFVDEVVPTNEYVGTECQLKGLCNLYSSGGFEQTDEFDAAVNALIDAKVGDLDAALASVTGLA